MDMPDRFPEGCEFVASFSGDEYVRFPDGRVFKASDDGTSLKPVAALPRDGAALMSEEGFLSCAARSRAFFAKAAPPRPE